MSVDLNVTKPVTHSTPDRSATPTPRAQKPIKHFKRPVERTFTRADRPHTTVLFGGLTWSHERLIKGAWEGLGYKCDVVPTPDVAAFQLGKEYGNNGQCNPTYFTVGNLVQFLQKLEKQGMEHEKIVTTTSSSRPVRVDRAASACTKRSIAWRCATPASKTSA